MAGWKEENSIEGGTQVTRAVPPGERELTPGIPGVYDQKTVDRDSRSMRDESYAEALLLDDKQGCRLFYKDENNINDSSRGTIKSTSHWGALLGTYTIEGNVAVCTWSEHVKRTYLYDKDGTDVEKDWQAMAGSASTKWGRLTLSNFHKRAKDEEEKVLAEPNAAVSLGLFPEYDSKLEGLLKLA